MGVARSSRAPIVAAFVAGSLVGAAVCAVVLTSGLARRYDVAGGGTTHSFMRFDTWTGRAWRYQPPIKGNEVTIPEGWREVPQP